MNEYEVNEMALKQVCKEIVETVEKINKSGMTDQLLERLDHLYHAKKDIMACSAMEGQQETPNMSGERGRSPYTGRYVSRDGQSFEEGFSQGYSQAMSQMSGYMSQAQGGGNGGGSRDFANNSYPNMPQRRW